MALGFHVLGADGVDKGLGANSDDRYDSDDDCEYHYFASLLLESSTSF